MFDTSFTDILNPDHELIRTSAAIDWEELHQTLSRFYSPMGRQGKPIRLMAGLQMLKQRYNLSDQRAVEMLRENVYWQWFCGFHAFQSGEILDASSLAKFRTRVGNAGMGVITVAFINAWSGAGLIKCLRAYLGTTELPGESLPVGRKMRHRGRRKPTQKTGASPRGRTAGDLDTQKKNRPSRSRKPARQSSNNPNK